MVGEMDRENFEQFELKVKGVGAGNSHFLIYRKKK